MHEWKMARCSGEENLLQAIADFEKQGYTIHTAMFAGVEVRSVDPGLDITKNSKKIQVSRYVLLGVREAKPQRVN
jgi:hypothetical protein